MVSADGSHVSIKYDATTGVTSAIESTPISGSPGVNNRRQVQFSSPIASTDSSVMVTGVAQITGTGSGTLSGGVTPSGTGSASTDAKLDQIKAGQCGGPGQPKCNMQIDETGTPTDGYLTAQKSDFSAAVNTTVGTINNLAGEGVRSSIGIGFNPIFFDAPCEDPTFAIPGGRGNLIVPMCDKKGAVSKIMDFLMWAFTAFYLWGLAVSSFKK